LASSQKVKKILIGDHAQNNSLVYSVIVSGKIAYIKVSDVSTEKESVDSNRLTAERFQRSTNTQSLSNLSVSYYQFNSQIRLDNENGEVVDKNVFNWHGLSIKGESKISEKLDLQVIINYMFSTLKGQAYRASEFGFGVSRRFFESKNLLQELSSLPYQFRLLPTAWGKTLDQEVMAIASVQDLIYITYLTVSGQSI